MDPAKIRDLLERVRGGLTVDQAMRELADLPFRDLGFAKVDHHRHLRAGFPEVVLGLGKQPDEVAAIVEELARTGANVLATRIDAKQAERTRARVPAAHYYEVARALVVEQQPVAETGRGTVLVVSAGTADGPIAEEAALTARLMGSRVETLKDVGVAGIHRVLDRRTALDAAEVIVVVAGMEGALPSVVKGLVARPVIAVPTSVGYGASFGGLAALLGMMNACASGVVVVNIDNGFGAGYAAALFNRKSQA